MSLGTIIGIGFTVLFGITTIFLALKKIYPAELLYIEEESLNLYDSVVKNISGLNITYKSQPIKENMFLIRGFLFKKGRKDIVPGMIESKLKISLPKKWIWHDSNIISKSEGLIIKTVPNENELLFDFGLFKNNEYVFFESLVETTEEKGLSKSIKFKHRIADTGQVTKEKTVNYESPLRKIRIFAFIILFLVINLLISISPGIDKYDLEQNILQKGIVISNRSYYLDHFSQIDKLGEQALEEHSLFHFLINTYSKDYVLEDKTIVSFRLITVLRLAIIISSLLIFVSGILIIRHTVWIVERRNIRRIIKSELKKRRTLENSISQD